MALPRVGVYVTRSTIDGASSFLSVTSVGTNPTFESDGRIRVETLLLDYSGHLYGSHLAVDFIERIRGQKTFPDAVTLAARIRKDVEIARAHGAERRPATGGD
jgi:riboflavin kinase/FMN adenylyltransferase